MGTRSKLVEGRPYEWRTYREVDELQQQFAKGISTLGLCPDQRLDGKEWNFLGIFSKNREEWAIADIACMSTNTSIVPFFDSLGVDALNFVVNQCEL